MKKVTLCTKKAVRNVFAWMIFIILCVFVPALIINAVTYMTSSIIAGIIAGGLFFWLLDRFVAKQWAKQESTL